MAVSTKGIAPVSGGKEDKGESPGYLFQYHCIGQGRLPYISAVIAHFNLIHQYYHITINFSAPLFHIYHRAIVILLLFN